MSFISWLNDSTVKHFPIEENPKRFIYYLLTNHSTNLQVRDLLIFIYSYRNLIYLFPVLALLEHKLYWGEGIRLSLIHNVPLYVPVMSCTINVTSSSSIFHISDYVRQVATRERSWIACFEENRNWFEASRRLPSTHEDRLWQGMWYCWLRIVADWLIDICSPFL